MAKIILLIKNNSFLVISTLIGWILFFIAYKLIKSEDFLRELINFGLVKFLGFLVVTFIVFYFQVARWREILNFYNIKASIFKLYLYKFASYPLTFLTPTTFFGGEPVRVALFSKDYKLDQNKVWATVLIESFLEILIQGLIASFGVLYIIFHFVFSKRIEYIIGSVLILWIVLLIFLLKRIFIDKKLFGKLLKKLEEWKFRKSAKLAAHLKEIESNFVAFFYLRNKRLFLAIFDSLLIFIGQILEAYVLLYLLAIILNPFEVFIFKTLNSVSSIAPIPAGLGINEVLQSAYFGYLLNLTHLGFLMAVLYKVVGLAYSFVGLVILATRSIKNIFNSNKND